MYDSNSHVVVEELLKFLIDKVDGDLLEAVVFKDLKTSDVEDGNKVGLLQSGAIQSDSESSELIQQVIDLRGIDKRVVTLDDPGGSFVKGGQSTLRRC